MTSYSDSLRLTKQDFNANSNTWGTVLNNQLDILDSAITGIASYNITGSVTVDMTTSATDGSDSNSKAAILKFTGLPTANCSVTTPAASKIYFVHSSLQTSAYTVFIHPTGSNVGVTVSPSEKAIIYCDGTDMIRVVGEIATPLFQANNLSDLTNVSAALVNLGFTASISELNVLDGITASVSELNVLDGITASVGELNFLDGVTSSIQGQINTIAASVSVLNSVFSAISLTKFYQSSDLTFVNGTRQGLAHGLSVTPKMVQFQLVCTSANNGYNVGDVIPFMDDIVPSGGARSAYFNATSISFCIGYPNGPILTAPFVQGSVTATSFTITDTNWKVRILAWA